ncbi:MAG TPA: sulfatase-like hydrolase/transferase [Rubrobacter sp.]|nr:sulfatase-like hydrolase/transferase [Rubrobacter sp.]
MEKTLGRTLTRREFLKVAGAGMAGASLLAGCGRSHLLPDLPGSNPSADRDTNVVLIIIDSLRKDHVGVYGNDRIRTPNLDALAKESLRFTRAYPESAPTICARRAIHTGLRTWPFTDWKRYKGIDVGLQGWQPIPNDQTTLAEMMRRAGYETVFVTDNLQQYDASMNFHRGFDAFDFIRGQTTDPYRPMWTCPPGKVNGTLVRGEGSGTGGSAYFKQYFANTADRRVEDDWFAPQVFTRASESLEILSKGGGPFFLTVDCYDPHAPWDPPDEYVAMYSDGYEGPEPYAPADGSIEGFTERHLGRMGALYSGEVTMMDRWLGRFLDKMEELNLFENTLLILLSDHGVAHGEHGIVGKTPSSLWPEVTDIPFFIRHPGGKGAGQTNDYYASTHDVAPTILGFLGVETQQELDGQDLSVMIEGDEPEARPHFTLGYHDHVFTRDEEYAMISANDGTEAKLYNLREDPGMYKNVAVERPDVTRRMFDDYVLEDAGGPLPSY